MAKNPNFWGDLPKYSFRDRTTTTFALLAVNSRWVERRGVDVDLIAPACAIREDFWLGNAAKAREEN